MRRSQISILLLFWCLFLIPYPLIGQEISVGIISDGEVDDRLNEFTLAVKAEMQKTIGSARKVDISPDQVIGTNWNPDQARNAYQRLEKQCDLLLLLGGMTTKTVLEQAELQTPTIALGVFAPGIQGIPLTPEGTSGRKNFSYVLNSGDAFEDLAAFHAMTDFKELAFVYMGTTGDWIDVEKVTQLITQSGQELNANITPLSLDGNNLAGSLAELPANIDAVFLAIPFEISPADARIVADFLIEKKLPSFSLVKDYVDAGILASNSDDKSLSKVMRKVAIMADDVVREQDLAHVKVGLNVQEELFLNMHTARLIGYSPPFELIFTANLLGNSANPKGRKLSLLQVLEMGLNENLGIKISEQDIKLSDQDLKTARSQFLPSADYSSTVAAINKGRANALLGQSQYSVTGTGTFSQLIYSEQALANIKIRTLLKEAQTYATEQQLLDITLNVTDAYLGILKAATNVTIQAENLQNSKSNLALAQRRESLGAASKADVFRWKGEVASAKQNLIQAQTNLFTAKAQLNALLNGVPGLEFDLQDVTLDGPLFEAYADSDLARYVKGPYELNLITEFLTEEAKLNYPTKKQLLSNAAVFERQKTLNKRLYYTPTVAGQAQLDNTFWRGGEAASPLPGSEFVNTNWNAGLNVSIPIFQGNRRAIDLQTTTIQQKQLGYQIENLDRNLELSVRANTLSLLAASTNIENSRESAENTARNYDLVQNLYKKGQISIIQLIDAQRTALQTKQAYAIAVYDYLTAFLQLENSIGAYSILSSEEERAEFEDRWQSFLSRKNDENPK